MKALLAQYRVPIVISIVLNVLLLLGLPFLLRFSSPPQKERITDAVRLADFRRPDPPPPKKQELKKEKPPPKVHPKVKNIIPKLDASNLSLLDVAFEADLGLADGMQVSLGVKIWNEADVDQKPVALFKAQPIYPIGAKSKNVTGRVELRMMVDRDGRVKNIEILKGEPEGVFEDATKEAVVRWRFQPAKVKGAAVACWVKTAINYELE
jgi:protein TonB